MLRRGMRGRATCLTLTAAAVAEQDSMLDILPVYDTPYIYLFQRAALSNVVHSTLVHVAALSHRAIQIQEAAE